MADKETGKLDISVLRTPIQISGKPVEQVLSSIHYGSPELRCLLMDECDLIFECKVCRALFRDLPNFISHKRAYCTKSAMENRHVTIASLPEEKVVVIQPQAPEETEKGMSSNRESTQQSKTPRPNLEETIKRIQSGELGKSHAYQVYTEAAEKLQRQKEGMKVATIRTTAIATNKNAVFIDVNMASVNIHERQQQTNGGGTISSFEQNRNDTSVTVIKRKTGDRHRNTRNVQKPIKQERHSSEPQKILMEHLKEIQHKVKQKVAAAQDKVGQPKRVRNISNSNSSEKDSTSLVDAPQKQITDMSSIPRVQKKVSDNVGLKRLDSENVWSDFDQDINGKDDSDGEEVKYTLVKADSQIHSKAAKENKSHTKAAAIVKTRKKLGKRPPICLKCNSVFATLKSLNYHNKIHHSAKRTFYPCPYCSSVFYYFYGITRHLSSNHSKTVEEVNAMREQLRGTSFTKPFSTPVKLNDITGVHGGLRSTRTFGKNLMAGTSQHMFDRVDTSLSDTQSSKRKSSTSETSSSESSTKLVHEKNSQVNTNQSENVHSLRSSNEKSEGTDKSKELIVQELPREAGSMKLKSRQQLKSAEKPDKIGVAENSVQIPTKPAATTHGLTSPSFFSRFQGNTVLGCPKCHRTFRRKISCVNHVKVCKKKGTARLKGRTQSARLKERNKKSKMAVDNIRVKKKETLRTGSDVVAVKMFSRHKQTSPLKNADKKEPNTVNTIKGQMTNTVRPVSMRSLQSPSSDRSTSLSRRSSSVDRFVKHSEYRNRSRERNSSLRDKRDSSVESTQSNVEGKSPRSHRNVLSRYATPAHLSRSPLKFDLSLKSLTGVSDESIDSHHQTLANEDAKSSDIQGNHLENAKGKVSEVDGHYFPNPAIESAVASDGIAVNQPSSQPKTRTSWVRNVDVNHAKEVKDTQSTLNNPRSSLIEDLNKTTASPQKSSVNLKSFDQLPQSSPVKSNLPANRPSQCNIASVEERLMSVPKQQFSVDSSDLLQNVSVSKAEKSPSRIISSENDIYLKLQNRPANCTSDVKEEAVVNEDKYFSKLHQGVELDSEKHTVTESFKTDRGSSEVLLLAHKDLEVTESASLQFGGDIKADNLIADLAVSDSESRDFKIPDVDTEQVMLKKSLGNFKGNNSQPQNVSRTVIISALSERPKRKRKVPSRNRDAEEMLSKILSHNKEVVPAKKAKLMLEAKGSGIQKQRLIVESSQRNSPQSNQSSKDEAKVVKSAHLMMKVEEIGDTLLNKNDSIKDVKTSNEESGRSKGRLGSNRIYILEKRGKKRKLLKCYDQMKVHKLIDEENQKCLECGESFSQIYNMRRHVIRQHLKWSRFKCKLCKFESYDKSECTTHLVRGHRNRTLNLRNVNHYIIDLVKQGSHARNVKKNETIKVKQQSESKEGNIYARPTVKKQMRLPQRTEGEAKVTRPDGDQDKMYNLIKTGSSKAKNTDERPTTQMSPEVKPAPTAVQVSKQAASVRTVTKKQDSTLVSLPTHLQTLHKADPNSLLEGKLVTLKTGKKNLPFNISTRNSPRTFDTRPYIADSGDNEAANASVSKQESISQKGKGISKKVAPSTDVLSKTLTKDNEMCVKTEKLCQDIAKSDTEGGTVTYEDSSETDGVQKSRNIFDKMNTQSVSPCSSNKVNHREGDGTPVVIPSSSTEINTAVAHQTSSGVSEVKVEGPHQVSSLTVSDQSPGSPKKSNSVGSSKAKVISYIIRRPPQKAPQASDEILNSEQLAKSLLKLKELGDQFSPSLTTPGTQQTTNTALQASKVTSAKVINPANLQKKQAGIPVSPASVVKATPVESLKPTQQKSSPTSKESLSSSTSSEIALAAALTKSGHISTTAASSIIVSHGQAGKFIIYTRPTGATEVTTGSVTKPSTLTSSSSSSSAASAVVVNTSDASLLSSPETPEGEAQEVFPRGTFVIRKHYL